jgi:hypothetical protein
MEYLSDGQTDFKNIFPHGGILAVAGADKIDSLIGRGFDMEKSI